MHTANVNLDACFAGARMPLDFGERRREGLREILRAMLARATEWAADAVLIAGNLFDAARVTRDTLSFLQKAFEDIQPVRVFIAPGDLDPCTPESPYVNASWPSNVAIFRNPEWQACVVEEARLIVHGRASGPQTGNLDALSVPERSGWVQVALVHQPTWGIHLSEAGEEELLGLDYVAVGHIHEAAAFGEAPTLWCSGAPESLGFDDSGERCCLEIELGDNGIHVTRVPSGRILYKAFTVECSSFVGLSDATDALRAAVSAEALPVAARVTLRGACSSEVRYRLPQLRKAAGDAFEGLSLVDETLSDEDYDELGRENTCLGMFVRRLSEELRDAPDAERERFVRRARDLGVAAYRGLDVEI